MLKVGNIKLKHGLMLAPMAGFSDYAMRRLCHEYGCEYSVTEMVSAKAVAYGDKKTYKLARISADEGPVALQIFGSEPSVMADAAARLSEPIGDGVAPVAIDINMGCPVPKIFNNGEGSALMKSPSLIYDIVKSVSSAISVPCTVKMRLGVDRTRINAVECALAAEEGGASLLTLHGRTRVELYSGNADMQEVAKVKKALHIPLIANGDIRTAEDAVRTLALTGADGVAIGRAAVGNPFVFRACAAALDGRAECDASLEERMRAAMLQLEYAVFDKGEPVAVREARKQIAQYFRGFRGAAELRAAVNTATTLDDVRQALATIEINEE